MASADSPLPILNSPAGMRTSSIFTPPPKSAASFFGGSFVSLKAVPAMVKSTTHAITKFLITCPPQGISIERNALDFIASAGRWEELAEKPSNNPWELRHLGTARHGRLLSAVTNRSPPVQFRRLPHK